jgi:hypothetical protein
MLQYNLAAAGPDLFWTVAVSLRCLNKAKPGRSPIRGRNFIYDVSVKNIDHSLTPKLLLGSAFMSHRFLSANG